MTQVVSHNTKCHEITRYETTHEIHNLLSYQVLKYQVLKYQQVIHKQVQNKSKY